MDIEKAQRWHYDQNAEQYDGVDQGLGLILSRVRLPPEASVLDIGCGTGNLTFRLCEKGSLQRLAGIDVSDGVLSIARKHARELGLTNFEFTRASAIDLPFPDQQFDVVVSNMLFHLIPDQPKALGEVLRVLRPSGSAVLQFLGGADFAPEVMQIFRRAWNEVLPQSHPPLLTYQLTVEEAGDHLRSIGVEDFEITWRRFTRRIPKADVPDFLGFWHLVAGYWRYHVREKAAQRVQDIMDRQVRTEAESSGQFTYTLDLLLLQFTKA